MANSYLHAMEKPIKGARFTLLLPSLDADGDPTDVVAPDSEISKDGGAFADCTEEATVVAGANGLSYLTLTGDETNCSMLGLVLKVASGPKATVGAFYPRVLPSISTGTAQAGAAGSITLAAGAPAYDLAGCIVKTTGGTCGGGGSGSLKNQARVITAYNTSSKLATVEPNWEQDGGLNPDNTTTYTILMTEMAVNAITARIGTGGIAAATFAAGAIDAAAIATGAIDADALAADAVAEIADGVFDEAMSGHTSAGTFGQRMQAAYVGTCAASDATHLTLDGSAPTDVDLFVNMTVFVFSASGVKRQSRKVVSYSAGREIEVDSAWSVNPSVNDPVLILPNYILSGSGATAQQVWEYATRVLTAGTNVNGSTFTAIPWNAAWDAEVESECTDALNAYDPPTNAEMVARTIVAANYALEASLTAIKGAGWTTETLKAIKDAMALEATLTAIKGAGWTTETLAAIGVLINNIKAVTDKVNTAVELDGAVYRFTTNALEQAPSGVGGTITVLSEDIISE